MQLFYRMNKHFRNICKRPVLHQLEVLSYMVGRESLPNFHNKEQLGVNYLTRRDVKHFKVFNRPTFTNLTTVILVCWRCIYSCISPSTMNFDVSVIFFFHVWE